MFLVEIICEYTWVLVINMLLTSFVYNIMCIFIEIIYLDSTSWQKLKIYHVRNYVKLHPLLAKALNFPEIIYRL